MSHRLIAPLETRHSDESTHWQIYKYQSQLLEKEEEEEGAHELVDSMEGAWRRVVAASPHLKVDEKASEFIYKFKEEMRMEKERSFLEFQERLIRSS
ncbi:unnamed protein product [Arabidopsis lyrata]|uniref:Predicted protein n=1 Tax=Arabidopsis lyrata subsp. lyrata TaxID=81972 RepID=D7L399_ARALL|nr:predicted protein [Arabidopsis lyrata subsp. lyrata]CAH8261530.1 unnamed protein product [Arabidopsis lyrata]